MWTQRASLAHDVRGSLLDLGAAKTLVKCPDSQKVSRGRNTIAPQVNMPRTPREVKVQGGTLNLLAEYLHSEKLVICFKQIASILPTVSESCNLKSAP